MNYKIISAAAGLVVWMGTAIAIRTVGHLVFITDSLPVMLVLYLASFVAVFFLAWLLFRMMSLLVQQVFLAAILMAMPGMVLDGLCLTFFPQVYPNMPAAAGVFVGSWLLLSYSAVFVSSILWTIGRRH